MSNCTIKRLTSSFTVLVGEARAFATSELKITQKTSQSCFRPSKTRRRTSLVKLSIRWRGQSLHQPATLTSSPETTYRCRSGTFETINKPCKPSCPLITSTRTWWPSTRTKPFSIPSIFKSHPAPRWLLLAPTTSRLTSSICSGGSMWLLISNSTISVRPRLVSHASTKVKDYLSPLRRRRISRRPGKSTQHLRKKASLISIWRTKSSKQPGTLKIM